MDTLRDILAARRKFGAEVGKFYDKRGARYSGLALASVRRGIENLPPVRNVLNQLGLKTIPGGYLTMGAVAGVGLGALTVAGIGAGAYYTGRTLLGIGLNIAAGAPAMARGAAKLAVGGAGLAHSALFKYPYITAGALGAAALGIGTVKTISQGPRGSIRPSNYTAGELPQYQQVGPPPRSRSTFNDTNMGATGDLVFALNELRSTE